MSTKDTFGTRLRTLREARGLSVYALAEQVGVARQYLGRIEAGAPAPGFDIACRLADALGVGVEAFRPPVAPKKKSQKNQ